MSSASRYSTCCVWGYLEAEPSGRRAASDSQPHVSAEVYDELGGRVAVYRSEEMRGERSTRRARAIAAAEAHAATLEAEWQREQRQHEQCRPRRRTRAA